MTTPDDIFARKEEDYPFVYKFRLPYIVQPAGEWEHSFASQSWQIVTKHVQLPPLIEIITGIQFNPESPTRILGPQEIYTGVSLVEIHELGPPSEPKYRSPEVFETDRNLLTSLLNDLQFRYLLVSGKYWWHEVSADHFVGMETWSRRGKGIEANWGGSRRQLPSWNQDIQGVEKAMHAHLREGAKLAGEEVFITDASRHYLSGEYHLMYVEIATSLEAITKKAYQALSCVYEKRMFNEGKLAGQVAHLLHSYCEWADADIDEVVRAVEARNEVVHHGRRRFDGKVAYKQLGLAVKAIEHIKDRLLVVQEEKD